MCVHVCSLFAGCVISWDPSVGDKAGNLLHVIFPITFFVLNALGSKCSTHAYSSVTRFDKSDVTNLQKSDKRGD